MLAVAVTESSATFAARRAATNLAAELRFNETEVGKVAIIVTEMATNLLKHAGSGQILLRAGSRGDTHGLEILAIDSGPGMSRPEMCVLDGFSTAGSSGTGLGAIHRLSAKSEIYTVPDLGTIVRVWCVADSAQTEHAAVLNTGLDIGGVCVPVAGETECGDAFAVRQEGNDTILMVADGLGHGPIAAEASQAAVQTLNRGTGSDVIAILESIHTALRGTRGAAVAVACLSDDTGTIRYCGTGNIVGAVVDGEDIRHFVSMHGIVGQQIRTPRAFDYRWNSRSTIVLHSDGISSNWHLHKYPGITRKSSAVIAGAIYRAAHRKHDDATVLVVRAGETS